MAFTFTPSNHYKYMLHKGEVDFTAQAHDLSLTFTSCDTTATTIAVAAGKFNWASDFTALGFCVGQEILTTGFTDAANNGRYVITAVTATDITVAETLVNEAGTGNEQITSARDDTITRASGSFLTDGFAIGKKIYTNSANAGNVGPFIVRNALATKLVVMPTNGTLPNLTNGTEANLTIGTYLVKALLVRSGFVFDQDDYATLTNMKGVVGPVATIAFVDGGAGYDSITDSGNAFVSSGLVAGNSFTVSGSASNDGTYVAITVSAGTIEVATASLTAEGAGAAVTITADDELATGSGYTQDTKLTGVLTHTEDDTNNRGNAVAPTITYTPTAGNTIGPTPGCVFVLDSSSDETICGYLAFGSEVSRTYPQTLPLTGATLRIS